MLGGCSSRHSASARVAGPKPIPLTSRAARGPRERAGVILVRSLIIGRLSCRRSAMAAGPWWITALEVSACPGVLPRDVTPGVEAAQRLGGGPARRRQLAQVGEGGWRPG